MHLNLSNLSETSKINIDVVICDWMHEKINFILMVHAN